MPFVFIEKARQHPQFKSVEKVYHTLCRHGYETLLAGGCVRDLILDRSPNDFDVATAATPDQVAALFEKTVGVGKQFGVMIVIEGEVHVEVATFRKDGDYVDGRRPQQVQYCAPEEDARRRDFTVNALFLDLKADRIVDYVGGLSDIEKRLIRTVGVAENRFREDHLRLLRALRFEAQLGFDLESETWQALRQHHAWVATVSRERIREEFEKLLKQPQALKAMSHAVESGVVADLFSGIQVTVENFRQSRSLLADPWASFFLAAIWGGARGPEIETWLQSLHGSRVWGRQILAALEWFLKPDLFFTLRLGAVIEKSFEPESLAGLSAFASHHNLQAVARWQDFLRQAKRWKNTKPAALVRAQDLGGRFQGPRLGRALQEAYWAQLEGVVTSRDEAVQRLDRLALSGGIP